MNMVEVIKHEFEKRNWTHQILAEESREKVRTSFQIRKRQSLLDLFEVTGDSLKGQRC